MEQTRSISDSKGLIIILGVLSAFGPMAIDLYLPGFSAIAVDLKVASADIQYSLTSFFAGLALGQLIYGPISDRYGRKKPLLFGIGLFIATSVLLMFANDLATLVGLRFVQAMGSCVGMVLTRAIIRDSFTFKDIPKVFSLTILVMGASPILAPLIGNFILKLTNWRGIFGFLVFFGVVAYIGSWISIKESLKEIVPIKVSFKNYLELFYDRQFVVCSIISGTVLAGMFSYIASSSIVFIEILKVGKDVYPIFFGLNAFGFVLVSQINIKLLGKYTLDRVLKMGLSLFLFNALALALVAYLQLHAYTFEFVLFCLVAGIGIVLPNISAKTLEFQAKRAGVASALMGCIQFFVASMGTMVVASMANLGVWAMVIGMNLFVGLSFVLYFFLLSPVTQKVNA